MLRQIYIIKNITPWMIEELKILSLHSSFDLILLREPPDFYKDSITYLKNNNIQVIVKPFKHQFNLKKVFCIIGFVIKHIMKFRFDYNIVIGLKSIMWFFKLNMDFFPEKSKIHAQFATQSSLIALLIKKYYHNNSVYTFTFHAHDIFFYNKWFKLLVRESEHAFCISEFNKNYVSQKYQGLDTNKIIISKLGVQPVDNPKTEYQEQKPFTIGFLSWFTEKKGIYFLLDAILQLKYRSDIKWRIGGDGDLKSVIIDFIKIHKLEDSVEFLGKLNNNQKVEFYNSIDVFILPSITLKNDMDGIPVVLMEAISFGLPIISTNVSGIPEICKNDFNGKLIQEKSSEEIVKSVLELTENPTKMNELRKNSLLLSKEYDLNNNIVSKIQFMNWK